MTDVFCSVKLCKHRISNICTKDAIQIEEKLIDTQSILYSENICKDFEEK